jgi:uncharacterized protein (DUF58 family)
MHDGDSVERAISAAASLAMSALRAGMQARVVTTAGWDSGHGRGRGHGPALLDGLAAAILHKPQPGTAPLKMAGGLEPVVVVTTDRCPDADVRSALGLSGPGATTVVLFETGRPAGAGPPAPAGASRRSGRTVAVRRGESFAAAWTAYVLSGRSGATVGR